jgi:uncharacterized protein (TIGR02246 family)
MKKICLFHAAAVGLAGLVLHAQEITKGPPAIPGGQQSTTSTAPAQRGEDENAIRELLDAFTKAFDTGDAAAAAATYTENAIVVDEVGGRVEGRATVRDRYASYFKDYPGGKIAIQVDSLRFLGPGTALEEGRTTITPAAGAGAPEITRFTAVYVKQDGQWRQAAVRDELAHDLAPHDRLKELEWLIGDWVNESQDAIVSTTCKWAKGGNFLDREFTIKAGGRPVLSGTQRIGWDPLKRQFKTWIFDSEGGHSEGFYTRNGDQWVVKTEGVGSDGLHVSATNIITRLGKDRMSWQSTENTVGASAVPGIDEFIVVRKPPEAGK